MTKLSILAAVAAVTALGAGTAQAQSGFGPWENFTTVDGVGVDYAVRRDSDGFRVAWRCRNANSRAVSCSVGAGQNKTYGCYSGSTQVGETGALGERATVRPGDSYSFPGEAACRGTGATSVRPFARISIEN
tara:strand:- start:38874 stop:39269 length:396 start_codon:yes stop_codon:yes gene_type:complete